MAVTETVLTSADAKNLKRGEFKRSLKRSRTAWLYIAPASLLMLIITFFPQAFQVWMAFTDFRIKNLRFNIFNPASWAQYAPSYVAPLGLGNFIKILTNNLAIENYDFGRLLLFNFTWTVVNIIFHVSLGVLIALALNSKNLIGRRIYRALFVLPWAIPGYIAALTWRNMFDENFGAINYMIADFNKYFGTAFNSHIRWFDSTVPPVGGLLSFLPLAFYAVLVVNVWLGWPFMTIVATGALQSIPNELYEAADMDGANGWQKFWNITVPMIRPAMVPAIMLGTIWTFNQFNVIYFVSRGGPFGRTEILITQSFKLVYEQRLYGVAAAFSIVVFIVLFILTMLQNRVTRATEAYNA
jgi:arabinogalactan oligomer/maltooligosaccharide transport system permease protein